MRRLLPIALALALASLAAGCSESPCQELGERLCTCTGASSDACEAQVEDQLDDAGLSDETCEAYLASCNAPTGNLCEWLLTEDGKRDCGIARTVASGGAP